MATATIPPTAVKTVTNTKDMNMPWSTEMAPSEIAFRMYPPALNW